MITNKELSTHVTEDDCWIVIDGEVWNVTEFMRDHPGGLQLLDWAGHDATALFRAVHPTYVYNILSTPAFRKKNYVGRLANESQTDVWHFSEPFYAELKNEMDAMFRDKTTIPILINTFLAMAWYLSAWWATFVIGKWWAVYLFGYGQLIIGLHVLHPVNHGSVTSVEWLRKVFDAVMATTGIGSTTWRISHHVGHHSNTNHAADPDIHHPPFLRLNRHDPYLPHYKYQHIYAWFLYFFSTMLHIKSDMVNMWREPRVGKAERKAYYTTFLLSTMITMATATYLHGWRYYVLAHIVSTALTGFSSSLIFNLSHTTEDTEFDATNNWAENQVRSSYNWAVGRDVKHHLINFLVGGLNYQIEHHLFPTIHPIYYPSIAPIVKKYCGKYNIPYRSSDTFTEAVYKSWQYLKRLGKQN